MEFRIPGSPERVDLVEYVFLQKSKTPQMKIFVGTDSISREGFWHYVLVVAFRYGNNGAHFIYQKSKIPASRIQMEGKRPKPDIFTKLWKEAEISINCAEYLRLNGIYIDALEMDYNKAPKWASQKLIAPTKGWAESLGFNVLLKPSIEKSEANLIAVRAADHICSKI